MPRRQCCQESDRPARQAQRQALALGRMIPRRLHGAQHLVKPPGNNLGDASHAGGRFPEQNLQRNAHDRTEPDRIKVISNTPR